MKPPSVGLAQVQRAVGNRALHRLLRSAFIQPKLTVGSADDEYERQADRVADEVMRMPDPSASSLQRSPLVVQRMCAECEEEQLQRMCAECEEEEEELHRVPQESTEPANASPQVSPSLATYLAASRSAGAPLSQTARAFFEPRLGQEFGHVRVHTDDRAAEASKEIGARAFTLGADIYFARGQYSPGSSSGDRLLGHELTHVVQQSRHTGNTAAAHPLPSTHAHGRALLAVQRQKANDPAGDAGAQWEALQSEFESLNRKLLALNENPVLRAERADLIEELAILWAQIGAPDQASTSQLATLRRKLEKFKEEREQDRAAALASWTELKEEYTLERARLSASKELSDREAVRHLDASYQHALTRKNAAGNYLRWYDISPLAFEMASERHIEKAWEATLQTTIAKTEPGKTTVAVKTWPWPEFKVTQLLLESGAATGQQMATLRKALRSQLDSAIRHQVRQAVATMLELGESHGAVNDWARAARARAGEAADEFVKKVPLSGAQAHKWTHRLHIAGKLTVVVDIGASFIDIWTSPPKDRPKKVVVHASRIAGGLAGVGVGARVGGKWGARFGPKGAAVGAFVGGVVGGFAGAWGAKKIATFIADEIWPPEDTYVESVAR